MTDIFPKRDVEDLISEERESVEVNGYEVRAVHSAPGEFHLAIYDEGEDLTGTLDGNRYSTVQQLWDAARKQVGLDPHEEGLGDLFG